MSGIIKQAVLIIKGKARIAGGNHFRFLAAFMATVHLAVAGIGALLCCRLLVAVSFAAAAAELFMLYAVKHSRNFFAGITVVYFATCIHGLAACVFLGWTYGFFLYNLVMIPMLFYMICMTEDIIEPKKYVIIYTGINCIATLLLRRYVYLGEPWYAYTKETAFWVSFFNHLVCFFFITIFSEMFILELMANRRELRRQTEELKRLADYDGLTKLRNRRSMLAAWEEIGREDYCVVMGDIDDFKKVNDTYGHEAGDEVLKMVASSMQGAVDKEDYVSRWGGEEFLMLVFGSRSYALKVVGKVQRELQNADLVVDGKRIAVTMTFGLSECREISGKGVDELIRRADRRLYIGKNSGKNCIIIKDE